MDKMIIRRKNSNLIYCENFNFMLKSKIKKHYFLKNVIPNHFSQFKDTKELTMKSWIFKFHTNKAVHKKQASGNLSILRLQS